MQNMAKMIVKHMVNFAQLGLRANMSFTQLTSTVWLLRNTLVTSGFMRKSKKSFIIRKDYSFYWQFVIELHLHFSGKPVSETLSSAAFPSKLPHNPDDALKSSPIDCKVTDSP